MTSSLDIALDLWRRGLSVIPVPRPSGRHDGKVPVIAWRAYQTRRPTERELRRWFAHVANVAIITGELSGVVAVDVDSDEALRFVWRRLPHTPWQTRTSAGFHLFYRHPGVRVPNRARIETGTGRLALDVRGDGGFVIAPGSIHRSGALYEFAGDWTVTRDRLPRFWPGWLARPSRPASPPPQRPVTGSVVERARRYLAAIPRPEIGHGSDAAVLYAACRLVRGFGLSETTASMLLWDWCGGRPGWTFRWLQQKVDNAARYGTEPHGSRLVQR